MKVNQKVDFQGTIGVIIGRFQVDQLHDGHKSIIDYVLNQKHSRVYIILGNAPTKCTKRNPLDYEARRCMIEDYYRDHKIQFWYVMDQPTDKGWSESIDKLIDPITSNMPVYLYGSRDSFINHYSGKYQTVEFIPDVFVSGNEVRNRISTEVKGSSEFRQGVIWAMYNQYPKVCPTVDIAVFDNDQENRFGYVFLGKKSNESKLRFIGGFVDPIKDKSFEDAARRECFEETGRNMEFTICDIIGTTVIDDWRYRQETDKIFTTFYAAQRIYGNPIAEDDISEIHRIKVDNLHKNMIVDEHYVLYDMMIQYIERK